MFGISAFTAWSILIYGDALAHAFKSTNSGWTRHNNTRACTASSFKCTLPRHAVIEKVVSVSLNGTYGEGTNNLLAAFDPIGLPELCVVTVNVTSSPTSSYRFGLFLPTTKEWKGRFLATGNGGFGGGINWPDMATATHFGMATLSTDTGHNSSVTNSTWALNNPEGRIDWGWRALHGSIVIGKRLTEAYYRRKIRHSYYSGCSTGGRQGIKELQISPNSFDGVLVGAPSWVPARMNPFANKIGLFNLPFNGPNHINVSQTKTLFTEVVRQCDGTDGVEDGIISAPNKCTFDFGQPLCGSGNAIFNESTCFTPSQLNILKGLYKDYVDSITGKYILPSYNLGTENEWSSLLNGSEPSPYGVGYIRNFLLNNPDWDWNNYNDSIIDLAERIDPGRASATHYDITPFHRRGGKLLMYHGLGDGLVLSGSSILYYNLTKSAMPGHNLDDFFRLLLIPGMQHCANSPTSVQAPWNIGAAFQASVLGKDIWSVPDFKDAKHDALLALVDWVEHGKPVESVIATSWKNNSDLTMGVARQRPICTYPRLAKWDRVGNVNASDSWSCPTM